MMSGTTRLTYLLLAGSFVLICISVYVLLSQARDLASARDELRETNTELAQRRAQLQVLDEALHTAEDMATMRTGAATAINQICSRPVSANAEVKALCAQAQWATSAFGRFHAAYTGVAAKRAAASTDDDWKAVRSAYVGLKVQLSSEVDPGRLWAARVEEGAAYADYRLGDLVTAEASAQRAFLLDNRSAFVGLTRLKIACAKHRPAEEIAQLYSEQRRNLEESIASPVAPMDKKYAGYELRYFDRDSEVRLVCAYANLPAAS